MINLPVLEHLGVQSYGLFPGDPKGSGIDWNFRAGVTLIAGINGLGKTTPFDYDFTLFHRPI